MSDSFLSQEEVDALLEGVTGESQKTVKEEIEAGAVRDYDISSQERIVRGRMPTMEIVNERFARNFRIGLFNFIRRSPEISVGAVSVQRYNAFLRELVVPTNFNIVSIRPLRGNVQTRLRKLDDGEFDAIILAAAGLKRLGLSERIRIEQDASTWLDLQLSEVPRQAGSPAATK